MHRIVIVGIGGCGCNVLHDVASEIPAEHSLVAINTDARSLESCQAAIKLQVGAARTNGLGTGGDISMGRQIAQGDIEKIRNVLVETKLVVVVLGLGGGTGTGAAPVVVTAAREAGATVLCLATFPFGFEGDQRKVQANLGIADLKECADALVVVRNDRLCEFAGEAALKDAFKKANEVFSAGVCTIWKMLASPGYINLDMADLTAAVRSSGGVCTFGYGDGYGEKRAEMAARMLLESPMLEHGNVLAHARTLLVSIVSGTDLTLTEVALVMEAIKDKAERDCQVAMGTVVDEEWRGRLTVTVLASEQASDLESAQHRESPAAEQYALPGMVPDMAHVVESGAGDARGRRKRRATEQQTKLTFEFSGKGRFKDAEPTIVHGEDLDIPTFIRRGIMIDR